MGAYADEQREWAESPKQKTKGKPGRKCLGTDVFVPVTMKVEPSELAIIESIAKCLHRSRSDVMREVLLSGLGHMMSQAFSGVFCQQQVSRNRIGF
jgi:hypothetical protein